MLCSDLEDNERDKVALNKVLSACLSELKLDQMVSDMKVLSSWFIICILSLLCSCLGAVRCFHLPLQIKMTAVQDGDTIRTP